MQSPFSPKTPRKRPVLHRLTQRSIFFSTALIAACVVSASVAAPQAHGASALALRSAVERALRDGPAARIARLESEQAGNEASAAESIYWPRAEVSSQAGYSNRLNERFEAVNAAGDVRRYGLATIGSSEGWFNFSVSQVLFDLARWTDARRAGFEAEVAALARAQRFEAVSYDVLEMYVGIVRLEALIARQRERINRLQGFDARAASLLSAGRSLGSEREEVALYLRESRLELQAREDECAGARRGLALLLGADGAETLPPLAESTLPDVGEGIAQPLVQVETAPDVRLLAVRRKIEELRLESLQASKYPTVALGAGYSHYGAKRFDNFADELRVGVDFRMPVFDGFRTVRSEAGATNAVSAARLRHESLIASKRVQLQNLGSQLAAAQRGVHLLAERQHLGEERIRLAELALDTQRGSLGVAIVARREVDRVVDAIVAARFEPILLWGALLREAGQLAATLTRGELPQPDEAPEHGS